MSQAEKLANEFSGPVLFSYVWWILSEAQARGIKKLYFLARDGYTLKKIADLFCQKFDLNISTEYLYCSRAAFRMPTYHFLGAEAFDLLLQWGYRVTPKSVLQRAELSSEERSGVYRECGVSERDENRLLSRHQFDTYAQHLRQSGLFRALLYEKSAAAYQNAIGYLKQEGLFNENTVAVVDSGWTGSMQRSLRQLMEYEGYQGQFTGFYFGMFATPRTAADGEYLTWYFSGRKNTAEKVFFCNNLFECLLAAPHGMTTGYRFENGSYQPVLNNSGGQEELALAQKQSECICTYVRGRLKGLSFCAFSSQILRKDTRRRLKRYMVRPTKEEATYYGQFLFCDDVTEAYLSSLASDSQKALLKEYSILQRVIRRVLRTGSSRARQELFWPYGVVAFLPAWKRWWWRGNLYLWEFLKYTIHRGDRTPSCPTEVQALEKLTDCADIVSFDVFDTLLYRVVNLPTDVFRVMEPLALEKTGVDGFAEKRIMAEQKARQAPGRKDVTLEQIYDEFTGLTPESRAFLMTYEKQMERKILRRDEAMAGLLERCASMGKRVLVISDMYHSASFIEEILRSCGICAYHGLYVSSEYNATKASGELFLTVEREERIPNRKGWLHIGDNIHADNVVPRSLGIGAARYDNGRYPSSRELSCLYALLRRIRKILRKGS